MAHCGTMSCPLFTHPRFANRKVQMPRHITASMEQLEARRLLVHFAADPSFGGDLMFAQADGTFLVALRAVGGDGHDSLRGQRCGRQAARRGRQRFARRR